MAADITSLVIEVKSVGIKEASTALSGLGTSAANAERRINALIEATKKMNAANELAAKSTLSIVTRLREQDALLGNMAVNSRAAGRGTQDLAAAMVLLSTSLNLMNQNIVRVTNSQRQHNNEMREAHALARGLSGSFGALWLTYGNLAGMSVGVAIGAGLKGIISVGKDVENTLEGIRVRAGESRESMNQVAEAVERIGKGVYGPQEVAKAFETLALAGLKAKESTLAIGAALNLATAGGTTIEKAAESLVTIGTAVGASAKSFDMLADGITAAANSSLASVDSIAESVKRASVVNKLYGASFDDILTQTAALAQLGIKNTAAGTAIVNFYSNSLGQTEKSKKALDALGMSFTDLNGKAKPIVDAFEEFTTLLNKFDLKSQQTIINDIFGERALRDVEGLRDAVNRSADDTTKYSNKLREIQGQIAEAAGTAALQAVQLGLTTSKQMETVGNTLRVSLSSAFTEIAPTITIVSDKLKEVLGSPEFVRQIANIAVGIANLTSFLVENYKAVGFVVEGFLLWKGITLGASMFDAIARGLTGVATTMGLVTVATNGAVVSTGALATALRFLPGIGLVLTGLTAAWALYNLHSGKAKDNAQQTAEAYNKDFLKALEEEAKRLEKTNEVISSGTSIKEADAVATRELALAKLMETNAESVASAQKARDDAASKLREKTITSFAYDPKNSKEAKNLAAAQKVLNEATEKYSQVLSDADMLTKRVEDASKRKKQLYLEESKAADEAAKAAAGASTYGGAKPNSAAINDDYAAALAKLNAQVKAAKKDMQNYEDKLNDQYKAGEIGKLQVIRSTAAQQIEKYEEIGKAIQKQIDIASQGKNKKADVERFSGLQEANTEAIEQAKRKEAQETSVYLASLRQETARDQVKKFEEEGQYVKAAALRWSTDYSPAVQALQKDFEKYGDTIPEIKNRLDQLAASQKAFLDGAAVREAEANYKSLSKAVENMFLAAENASQGQGISGVVKEALNASKKYEDMLPGLTASLERFKLAADTSDDPKDQARYEDALNNQLKIANKYKTMWANTGKAISDSLTTAFGKSGKAAGGMAQALIAYSNTDNKNLSAKSKLYGDLAASAQGFFSEGSKGYKLMGIASQAASAIEIASTLATIGPKVASGVAALFAEGGWAGFAGAAAFLALMAGLGFSGGGSSSAPPTSEMRQKSNGTGSVLGNNDSKSESILNALEIIAKDSGLGLVHFNSMDKSLQQLVVGISGLSSLLVRGTNLTSKVAADELGGAQKTFASVFAPGSLGEKLTGGAVGKLVGSLFGGKKTVEDVGIKIDKGSLGDLLKGVNASQYTDIKKKGGLFSSDKYSTDTKSLGSEINNQFTMVIKSLTDTVKGAASVLGVSGTDFENKLKSFSVNIAEISTKDLTGEEIQAALESAFSKLGDDIAKFAVEGLDKFQKVGEGALETLARITNDLVQVQDVFAVLGQSMSTTGMAAVQSSQDLIGFAGTLEKLTEGTKFFVDNFLTDAERLKPIQASLSKEMTRLGLASVDTVEEFKALVLSQNLNTKAGQEMYAALINVAPAFMAVSEAATKAAEAAADLASKRLEMQLIIADLEGDTAASAAIIAQQRALELVAMDASLRPLQERINMLNDERSKIDSLKSASQTSYNVLSKAVSAQKEVLKSAYDAQVATTNAQITSLTAVNKSVSELSDALDSALGSAIKAVGGMTRATAQALLTEALTKAQASGQLPTADSMKDVFAALGEDSTNSFSTLEDFKKDAGITAGKLAALNDITKSQKSVNELQLEALRTSLDTQKAIYDSQVAGYDSILSYAQQQLDAMNGTQLAVKDVVSALVAFNGAVNSAIVKQQQAGIIANTGVPPKPGQIASPQGVNSQQIADLYKNVLGRTASQAELDFQVDATKKNGWSASDLTQFFYTSPEYMAAHGSHKDGLDEVPFDNYRANLHKGEKVLTAKQSKGVAQSSDMEAIVNAVNELKADNSVENQSMVSDLRFLKKLFQNMSPNGQTLQVTQTVIT